MLRNCSLSLVEVLCVAACVLSAPSVSLGQAGPPAPLADDLQAAEPAYTTLNNPTGEFLPYALDSGVQANRSTEFQVAYAELIEVPNAGWLRLYFGHIDLAPGSFVRMTSVLDGEVQELDAAGLDMWSATSAYFNGDSVYLELVTAPGTENRVVLDRLAQHRLTRDCGNDLCGMCGTDDRVPSAETWSGRLMPVGCTGSIYNTQSCIVTAGHCLQGGWANVIQFNVPNSQSNCNAVNPPVAEQFPVLNYQFQNDGIGADWGVARTGTNSLGQTIYQRYGTLRPLADAAAPEGATVAVWGYGVDETNGQETRSQTQQTSSGEIGERYYNRYEYSVDVTYGNSGSALIYNDTIIGIVTHCGFSCDNIATRIDVAAFETAREDVCGYCDAGSSSTAYEHISRVQIGLLDNSSGSSGYGDYTSLSTELNTGISYPITVTLGSGYSSDKGAVWIDWNQDSDFSDSGEAVITTWTGAGPYTGNVTPPLSALLGETRMRIRIQDGDYDPILNPCGTTDYGEVEDYTIILTPEGDFDPPLPNPMTFASPPAPVSTTAISMTATTGTDETPPVQYEFDFTTGGAGHDSGWLATTTYTDTGLSPNMFYAYRVRARDSRPVPNVGSFSPEVYTATLIETPTGVSFGTVTTSTIDLTATGTFSWLTTGNSGLYFDSITTGGDGGLNQWVQVTTDQATGLTPNTSYTFQAKGRNRYAVETVYGPSAAKVTLAAVPGAPGLSGATTNSMVIDVANGGNPAHTEFAIYCVSSAPNDGNWTGRYVSAAGGPVAAAVWRTDATWGAMTATGMQNATTYTFAVKARNTELIETALGPTASLATGSGGFARGDMDCNGVINALDINPFVTAMTNEPAYYTQFPNCDHLNGDINCDGVLNALDINPFVQCITGGECPPCP